jgi:hypothetical protein
VRALRDAIRKDIPEHKPGMIGGFLGFRKYHYKYASGREGDTGVVAISSQKQYSSLYLGCTGAGYLAEKANTASAKSPSANAASDSNGILIKAGSVSTEYSLRVATQTDSATLFTVYVKVSTVGIDITV